MKRLSKGRIAVISVIVICLYILSVLVGVTIINHLRQKSVDASGNSSAAANALPAKDEIIRLYYEYARNFSHSGLIFIDDVNNDGILDMLYRKVLDNKGNEATDALKELKNGLISHGYPGAEGEIGFTEIYSYDSAGEKVVQAAEFEQSSYNYEVFLVNDNTLWDYYGLYDVGSEVFISYGKDFSVTKKVTLKYGRDTDSIGFNLNYYIDDYSVSYEKYDKYSLVGDTLINIREGKEYTPTSSDHYVQSLRVLDCFSNTTESWKERFPELR